MAALPLGAAVAVAAGLLAGCHHKASDAAVEALPAADTAFVVVEEKLRPVTEDVVGTVRSEVRAAVEPKVSGRIEKINVDLGDKVEAGQVLATVDAAEIRARLDRATADRDQAARDWKRAAALLEKQVASRQEYDNAEARYRAADAARREAETMLGYVEVRAPFAGVVARRLADPGDFATPGKPVLEIENPGSLRFEVDIPEALIGGVESGDVITVTVPSAKRAVEGRVAEIAPAADAGTRSFPVRINLPAVEGLRAGQFGRAAIPVGEQVSARVPVAALVVRGQMEMVFVRDGDRVVMRLVRTGKRVDEEIEILSGVRSGEEVATVGTTALRDGQPVKVLP